MKQMLSRVSRVISNYNDHDTGPNCTEHIFDNMLHESIIIQVYESQRWTRPRFDIFDFRVAEVDW